MIHLAYFNQDCKFGICDNDNYYELIYFCAIFIRLNLCMTESNNNNSTTTKNEDTKRDIDQKQQQKASGSSRQHSKVAKKRPPPAVKKMTGRLLRRRCPNQQCRRRIRRSRFYGHLGSCLIKQNREISKRMRAHSMAKQLKDMAQQMQSIQQIGRRLEGMQSSLCSIM